MASQPISFYNRHTARIETEAVYGERPLRFVYETAPGRLLLHGLVIRRFFSRLYGWLMDRPRSRKLVHPFIAQYGVDVDELEKRPEEFASFNDFFSRRLKPGARPIDGGGNTLVFPADGRHLAIPDASACDSFLVKGVAFDMRSLLGAGELAERYARGSVLISRLCPVDYHRFHFPFAGMPGAARLINGPLHSVSPIALARRPTILWENRRFITVLHTQGHGDLLLLEIGAACVGSVAQTYSPGVAVEKGAEKGYFCFGGSSVMTIAEPGRLQFSADLLEHGAAGREVYARMGEPAGQLAAD